MSRPMLLPALALICAATVAQAEAPSPGSHFVTNWDADENGSVSLEEATTRRGDIFTTFDADEDAMLSETEYAAFDEARAADQAAMREEMAKHGKGKGTGHGKGMGEEAGMMRAFNDVDGDGMVSRDEFLSRVPDWFAMMDRNGDGAVSVDDFGKGN